MLFKGAAVAAARWLRPNLCRPESQVAAAVAAAAAAAAAAQRPGPRRLRGPRRPRAEPPVRGLSRVRVHAARPAGPEEDGLQPGRAD